MSASTFYAVARVDEQKNARETLAAGEIVFDQGRPGFDLFFRRFGEAVAWHVDEKGRTRFGNEEVQLLGAARRVGRASKAVLADERVDQAGFADVRSSGERDFDRSTWRQMLEADDAFDERPALLEQRVTGCVNLRW